MLEDEIRKRALGVQESDKHTREVAQDWIDDQFGGNPERLVAAVNVIAAARRTAQLVDAETIMGMDALDALVRAMLAWDALGGEHV